MSADSSGMSGGMLQGINSLIQTFFGTGLTKINGNQTVNGTTKGTSNTNTMDDQSLAALHGILGMMLNKTQNNDQNAAVGANNGQYTKQQAIDDSQGLIGQIFQQYKNNDLPTIFNAQNASGGYNSTTGQLMANDAYGNAVNKSAQAVQQNIQNYAAITDASNKTAQNQQSLDLTSLLTALGAARGDVNNTTTDTTTQQKTDTSMKNDSEGLFGSWFG